MKIDNREDWLKVRLSGIGASEASAVIGLNPYMNNQQLWEYKTGIKIAEDIGEKPYVKYGVEAEEHLRAMFALDFPQYEVGYDEFDLIRNSEYPFIFATLDGRLIEKETGRKGILEVKTTEILKSMQKEKWKEKIPDNYYVQIIHQLLATEWDFAILKAQLKYAYGDNVEDIRTECRHYKIERAEVQEDLDYLKTEEIKFWEYVKSEKKPNLLLPSL